jgi:starvation-inducible DNA-binding protein
MQTINSLKDIAVVEVFGALAPVRIGLSESVRRHGVLGLHRLRAHTAALCDLYRKAHWQTSRATFYQLHLLFNRHHEEQADVLDALGERVRTQGGAAVALPRHVGEESRLARAPRGRADPTQQITRLVEAHEGILLLARPLARRAGDDGDEGTYELIVSQVVRPNERHSRAVGEYLAEAGPSNGPRHAVPSGQPQEELL